MPFQIIRGDITKLECDAIVNAANNTLLGGGGVDGAIHAAAGPELLKECAALGGCATGDAKITKGYRLPAKYVIHTVGPVYRGGGSGEEELLRSCYRRSLSLAEENGCSSVAFPMISAGVYGYPWDSALDVAESEIRTFLDTHEMTVYLVIFSGRVRREARRSDAALQAYLRRKLGRLEETVTAVPPVQEEPVKADILFEEKEICLQKERGKKRKRSDSTVWTGQAPKPKLPLFAGAAKEDAGSGFLHENAAAVWKLDESFSEMLLRKIDEAGMTDAECYKKANVDKRLFSKIRSNAAYQPKKATALAFAVALRLSPAETEKLLKTAGFALSDSNLFDVIVKYYIEQGIYDIYEINEALFDNDQPLLGSVA